MASLEQNLANARRKSLAVVHAAACGPADDYWLGHSELFWTVIGNTAARSDNHRCSMGGHAMPLDEDDFLFPTTENSHGGAYHLNEFSLKAEAVIRVSLRWDYSFSGSIDYPKRDYYAIYADFDNDGVLTLVDRLKERRQEQLGDEWFASSLESLRDYFADDTRRESEFGDAALDALLVAFANPVRWKRDAMRSVLRDKRKLGHEGIHLDIFWSAYTGDQTACTVRLLNSWENEPVYVVWNEKEETILPREYVSFAQSFEPECS